MDKATLRSVISALTPNTTLTVHMMGSEPVQCTVESTARGRGKGGSLIAVLKHGDGQTLTISTPKNEEVLSVTLADGTFHGYRSESEVPVTVEPNAALAATMKEGFARIVGPVGVGAIVTLQSTDATLNGTFTVVEAKLARGRFGQVQAKLRNNEGELVDFWTYRHSGLITSWSVTEVVPAPQEPAVTTEAPALSASETSSVTDEGDVPVPMWVAAAAAVNDMMSTLHR